MKHVLLLASVLLAMPAWARTLSPDEALQRARGNMPSKVAGMGQSTRLVKTGYTAKQQPAYYIFENSGDKGYMVLAADDVAVPVLGYSETGSINPDDMPVNLRGWLESYAAEIAWAAERQESGKYIMKDLTKQSAASSRESWAPIAPLCTTKWNQSNPYDLYAPDITYYGQSMKAAAGCVATAMAQLMKYHNYPAQGKGSITYTWRKYDDFYNTSGSYTDETMTMDFSATTFEWDKMLDVYPNSDYTTSDENAEAVATLMKACGYSVEMSYGPESGAVTSIVVDALKNYFGYDASTRFYTRDYYDIDTWEKMIYDNLKNVGPVQYSGRNDYGGHSFIVDGYSADGYFHLNWGWGGMSDGYFLITGLDPESQGIGGSVAGYNSNQGAILGAQPAGATIPKMVPFQLAIVGSISPSLSSQRLTIEGRFGNNGGNGTNVRVGMQFCDATTDELVATAVYGNLGTWTGNINYGIDNITATIPSTLPAGVYKVYPAASTDGGSTYQKAIAPIGQPNYVLFAKDTDGTYEVAQEYPLSIDVADFSIDTSVYNGLAFGVTATAVNNNDSETLQEVNLGFITSDMNLVAVGNTMVVDLRAGESMKLPEAVKIMKGSVTAGETYLVAYVDMNSGMIINEPVSVTVQTSPGAATLQTTASGFSIVDAESVVLDNFRVDFDVYCQSGYYADKLYVLVFNENLEGYNIDNLPTPSTYFIEAENWIHESNIKLGTPTALEVGKRYAAALFYMSSTGLKQLSNAVRFTVAAESGIDDIKAESIDGSVSAVLSGGILSVTAASDIRSVDVYDLSGAHVATSATSTADLTGASDGVYVVKVTTADGTASLKLMK